MTEVTEDPSYDPNKIWKSENPFNRWNIHHVIGNSISIQETVEWEIQPSIEWTNAQPSYCTTLEKWIQMQAFIDVDAFAQFENYSKMIIGSLNEIYQMLQMLL